MEFENCTLAAGPSSHDAALTVEYAATVTGDAEITELTYTTNDGEQSVSSPANEWSQTVDVDAGVELEITANVEVSSGSAEIGFLGSDGSGLTFGESDSCSIDNQ